MHYNTLALDLNHDHEALLFDLHSLYAHLESVRDKRDPRGVRYPLAIVLVLVILAKLAGEDEPEGIADWVSLRQPLLEEALAFKRKRMPHAITYSRILGEAVEVEELQQQVSEFFCAHPAQGQSIGVAIDGKVLRGTIQPGQARGVYLLAAYLPAQGIVLMQVEIGPQESELTQAPRLLRKLDLRGKVVTGDALFTQQNLSEEVVAAGGEYVWVVKDNQPGLR